MKARNRQSHVIALRLTPADYNSLKQSARQAGLTLSEYIRQKLNLRGER